jgi:hypothetical protein
MQDGRCADCGVLLGEGSGWIVPLAYPDMEPFWVPAAKISICDLCLVTRTEVAKGKKILKPVG